MKRLIPIAALLLTSIASAQTLKIGVIDTGLDLNDPRIKSHICPTGSKDFTRTGLEDTNGHGTFVTGLIEEYAGEGDYCLLIYKYYEGISYGPSNLINEINSIVDAINNGARIINISSGGEVFSEYEYLAIRDNPEVTFVVAAGNNSKDLDIPGNEFYPASLFLENEIVVSAVDGDGDLVKTSNYGKKVKAKELGLNVLSYLPNDKLGRKTGTSISTAVYTGKLIRKMLNGTR